MREPRPVVCMALDPIPSVSASGTAIHRHCMLPAGHTSYHESRDIHGNTVHRWEWRDEPETPAVASAPAQLGIFDFLPEPEV